MHTVSRKNLDNLSAKEVMEHLENEKDFQNKIARHAQGQGWKVAHFPKAQDYKGDWRTAVKYDGKGFPDLVLVKGGTLIFAELKSESGRLSEGQMDWAVELGRVAAYSYKNVWFYVWLPRDWDEIVKVLD